MALKTIEDFYNDLLTAKEAQPALVSLSSTSKTAIWRLLLYISAVSSWLLQGLVVEHINEVNQIIANTKPGTARWYRYMAMSFQFGHELVPDQDYYDNTGLSDEDIEVAKVVKQCSSTGVLKGVRIKVAGDTDGDLSPLTILQETALKAYLERVKYSGVRVYLTNSEPDKLFANQTIYYDPLVLDANGKRLDGTNDTPVQTAIDTFLRTLPFNGLFVAAKYVDALQAVDGVVIPHVIELKAKYGSLAYMPFTVSYLPDAGYLRAQDITISYLPHEPI